MATTPFHFRLRIENDKILTCQDCWSKYYPRKRNRCWYDPIRFKKDDEVEKEEVEKKSSGGIIIGKGKDYIKDLL